MTDTTIHFNEIPEKFDSVLVVQQYNGQLVYVHNRKRKWELTGGKTEPGETIEETAIRESFEESGAHVDNVKVLGFYQLPSGHVTVITSADVVSFDDIPATSETIDRQLGDVHFPKEKLSFQDNVYTEVFKHLGLLS